MHINGIHYHVETTGNATQHAPLWLLHGFTGSGQAWADIRAAFEPTRSVTTFDVLGHGQTDSPPDAERYSMAHAAADVLAIPAPNAPVLAGYSMGARLALYIAVHYPQRLRALILESGSPGLKTKPERAARRASDEKIANMLEHDGIEAFVHYWETLPLWHTQQHLAPEIRQRLHDQRLRNNPVGLANSLRGMGTGAQPSLWDDLPALTLPVLLIAGEHDAKFVAIAREMHALLPNSSLVLIPHAGHTIHLEQREAYIQTIEEFLSAIK